MIPPFCSVRACCVLCQHSCLCHSAPFARRSVVCCCCCLVHCSSVCCCCCCLRTASGTETLQFLQAKKYASIFMKLGNLAKFGIWMHSVEIVINQSIRWNYVNIFCSHLKQKKKLTVRLAGWAFFERIRESCIWITSFSKISHSQNSDLVLILARSCVSARIVTLRRHGRSGRWFLERPGRVQFIRL